MADKVLVTITMLEDGTHRWLWTISVAGRVFTGGVAMLRADAERYARSWLPLVPERFPARWTADPVTYTESHERWKPPGADQVGPE